MPARQAAQHHAHAKKKGAGAQRGVNGALVGHGREFHGEGRRSTPLSARRCDPLSQKRAPREQFAPTWHKSVKNEIQAPSSPPVQTQTPLQTRCLPSYRSCSQTTMYAEPIYDSLHQDIFTEKHALLRSFVLIFFPVLVHTKTALEKFHGLCRGYCRCYCRGAWIEAAVPWKKPGGALHHSREAVPPTQGFCKL